MTEMEHQAAVQPLSKLHFDVDDLTKTYEQLMKPLNLFAPFTRDTVSAGKKFELERPVTPIKDEVKKAPRALNQLTKLVRRRLTCRPDVAFLSTDDQQQLASVLMSEVNCVWPNVQSLAEDPALTNEENLELKRRITVHIVTVCQTLFEHYLFKAQLLNKRGVFSTEANMSRLKAQLALDANKFLNVLIIRRYILADLMKSASVTPCEELQMASKMRDKLPTHPQLIQQTFSQGQVVEEDETNPQYAIRQMMNEMPALDVDKLCDIFSSLPDVPETDTAENAAVSTMNNVDVLSVNPPVVKRKTSEGASRDKVMMKRSESCSELNAADTLAEEFGIERNTARKKPLRSADGRRLVVPNTVESTGVKPATADRTMVTPSTTQPQQQQQQAYAMSRARADLMQLVSNAQKDHSSDVKDNEELAPLLQAVIGDVKHDNKQIELKAKLELLEEREKQRQQEEIILLPKPEHAQPDTVTKTFSNNVCVRTSDKRVSERTCLSSVTLQSHSVIYNDLNNEMDSETVKELDRTLCLQDELSLVYDEMSKTLTKDHLKVEATSTLQPCIDDINLRQALTSSAKDSYDRVVNKQLIERALECQKIQRQTQQSRQVPVEAANSVNTRSHSSWLKVWKQTVNTDDYMKYLATQETDYLHAIFHLYDDDSNSNMSSVSGALLADGNLDRHSSVQRNVTSSAADDARIRELKAMKSQYSAGLWNVNSVLLGGLGKDPQPDAAGRDAESSPAETSLAAAQTSSTSPNKSSPDNSRASYIIHKGQRKQLLKQLEEQRLAAVNPVSKVSVQDRLEVIWTSLLMSDSQKLEMALKYSSDDYHHLLRQAVDDWQTVTELIIQREQIMKQLETFERVASRPSRLVHKGNSTDLLSESQTRSRLKKKISEVDAPLKKLLLTIETKYNDVITYQGRPYCDKMKRDHVEMLYWLQEERKAGALKQQSQLCGRLPPLGTTLVAAAGPRATIVQNTAAPATSASVIDAIASQQTVVSKPVSSKVENAEARPNEAVNSSKIQVESNGIDGNSTSRACNVQLLAGESLPRMQSLLVSGSNHKPALDAVVSRSNAISLPSPPPTTPSLQKKRESQMVSSVSRGGSKPESHGDVETSTSDSVLDFLPHPPTHQPQMYSSSLVDSPGTVLPPAPPNEDSHFDAIPTSLSPRPPMSPTMENAALSITNGKGEGSAGVGSACFEPAASCVNEGHSITSDDSPAALSSSSASKLDEVNEVTDSERPLVRDTQSDLLLAMRQGKQLRKVDERRSSTQKHVPVNHLDVQSLMEAAFEHRRKAREENDPNDAQEEADELNRNKSDAE